MEQKDFRSIGRDAQEALRERAVYLVLHEGKTQAEAAGLVGVHRQVVNRWIGRHRDEGAAGLQDGRRVSSRKGSGILTASFLLNSTATGERSQKLLQMCLGTADCLAGLLGTLIQRCAR